MSELFMNSYFSLLPNEVLIKILKNVDTATLLNFCEVFDCDCFLQDRQVIKSVDFCKKFVIEDLSLISKKIAFEHVTTLNVNCMFWITPSNLRRFVSRMINLENLYAIQTSLSLSFDDTYVFSKSKIKKLAVTLKRKEDLGSNKVPSVETLYLSAINVRSLVSPLVIEFVFPHLKNLWVDVEESCGREIILNCLNAKYKNKIFCQINAPTPSIRFDHYGLSTFYDNRRTSQPYVVCCERFPTKSVVQLESNLGSWTVLDELHCSKPYGPEDARRLYTKENTLDDILFEELNFYHSDPICIERCRRAVKEILASTCATRLKRLSVMMCLFQSQNMRDVVSVQTSNSFKKKRIWIEKSAFTHPVADIFKNFTSLQHLEIYICNQTIIHQSALQGYSLISHLSNLRSLIVEVPITLDGSFLHEVFDKCTHLEVLKLTSAAQNEKLNINVCNSIAKAKLLKDFKYENYRIPLDRLLQRLASVKSQKLERIVLVCKEIDKFSAGPLKEFLEVNPQLIFLYFLLRECTETSLKMARQTLNSYKKKHRSKVFIILKDDSNGVPVPDVHLCEMAKNSNNVATLRPLEHFLVF